MVKRNIQIQNEFFKLFHWNEKKLKSSLGSELGPLHIRVSFRNVKLKEWKDVRILKQNYPFKVYLEKKKTNKTTLLRVAVNAFGSFLGVWILFFNEKNHLPGWPSPLSPWVLSTECCWVIAVHWHRMNAPLVNFQEISVD